MKTIPIWLDTDPGSDIDDLVALAYLLRQPACELVGVSTVSGPVEDRSRVAAAVAAAAGCPDVPIYSGASDPLGGRGQPTCNQAKVLTDAERARSFPPDPQAACAALVEAARARPGELVLLTIGPLTNAAEFFRMAPELPGLLKEMVLMAGLFWPETPGGEWNVVCDPEAARRAAEAPIRRTWFGLDVTRQCQMPADEVRRQFTGELLGTVFRFAEVWFNDHPTITFHDPLAAACIFEPGLCTYETAGVEVTSVGDKHGCTLLREGGSDRLARTVRSDAFFEHYFAVARG